MVSPCQCWGMSWLSRVPGGDLRCCHWGANENQTQTATTSSWPACLSFVFQPTETTSINQLFLVGEKRPIMSKSMCIWFINIILRIYTYTYYYDIAERDACHHQSARTGCPGSGFSAQPGWLGHWIFCAGWILLGWLTRISQSPDLHNVHYVRWHQCSRCVEMN